MQISVSVTPDWMRNGQPPKILGPIEHLRYEFSVLTKFILIGFHCMCFWFSHISTQIAFQMPLTTFLTLKLNSNSMLWSKDHHQSNRLVHELPYCMPIIGFCKMYIMYSLILIFGVCPSWSSTLGPQKDLR